MTLLSQGALTLRIDGRPVYEAAEPSDQPRGFTVEMSQGAHPVEIAYSVKEGPGAIEWVWTPPGGATSIVPPSALSPPQNAGVGPVIPPDALGASEFQPADQPVETVP
jgi:hypothetical protein